MGLFGQRAKSERPREPEMFDRATMQALVELKAALRLAKRLEVDASRPATVARKAQLGREFHRACMRVREARAALEALLLGGS